MKAMMWRGETEIGEDYLLEEIPAELVDQAAEYREKLIETLAEADDEIMHMYLEGEHPTRGAAAGRHPPGHHRRQDHPGADRLGIQEQGRAAHARRRGGATCRLRWMSRPSRVTSPVDESVVLERKPNDEEPFSSLAFKIAAATRTWASSPISGSTPAY